MPATYEPIATTSVSSPTTTITFSGIPNSYTDLRIVLLAKGDQAGLQYAMRYNSVSTTTYSRTFLSGNGTTASSGRSSSASAVSLHPNAGISNANDMAVIEVDIFDYTSSQNKTCLAKDNEDMNGSGWTNCLVGLWRDSSAITAVSLIASGGNFAAGSTASIYGILKA